MTSHSKLYKNLLTSDSAPCCIIYFIILYYCIILWFFLVVPDAAFCTFVCMEIFSKTKRKITVFKKKYPCMCIHKLEGYICGNEYTN